MRVLDAIGHALAVAGSMTWEITWSLILGFTLSAVVQAVIRRQTVVRLLGDAGELSWWEAQVAEAATRQRIRMPR